MFPHASTLSIPSPPTGTPVVLFAFFPTIGQICLRKTSYMLNHITCAFTIDFFI